MSKNKYRISKQAIEDLNDIWVYTFHKWSKEQADRYYDLIIGEIEFIADNYMIGYTCTMKILPANTVNFIEPIVRHLGILRKSKKVKN